MVTSALVIAEGHGWFLRRYDQRRALEFLLFINALPELRIEPFDSEALARTSRLLKKFTDQKVTLADCHGLSIMSERRAAACWSTDRRLGLTGVPLVL
jgi:hypothetical protein